MPAALGQAPTPTKTQQRRERQQHRQSLPVDLGLDTGRDLWAATDALGRRLPGFAEAGPPRPGRTVGVFYFLWLGEHGDAGPFDVTRILARDPAAMGRPDSPLWGPVGAPHHWGEPAFGYYRSDDEWVLRRHARMLADAGVDVVVFDVSNGLTYPRSYRALCRAWSQVRREGGRTPQVAFLCPFGAEAAAPVVEALFDDLYGPGLHRELWFRWRGRPLLLADPAALRPERMRASRRTPGLLGTGHTYGQTFTAAAPFTAVGGSFPTYHATASGMTLSLYRMAEGAGAKPAGSKPLLRREFRGVRDNSVVLLESPGPMPAGRYYLEMSEPVGSIGWWSETGDRYAGGRAWEGGAPVSGDRSLFLRHAGGGEAVPLLGAGSGLTAEQAEERAGRLRSFFTFRKPQPDYFAGQTGPDQWGWLEVYPQKPFGKAADGSGRPEQVPVGVAQNAVEGRLGALSHPRSLGRSHHSGGATPGGVAPDHSGRNFAEQWERALRLDPEFVFVTGWNEWVAGRFGADAPFHGAGPVTFVDQFDHEHSRDIEPVAGGHTDNYYYQFVSYVRRYKGVRPPPPPARPLPARRTIWVDGRFSDWTEVGEAGKGVGTRVGAAFEDDRFDTEARDHPSWNVAALGRYRNSTGRNDLTTLKVAHDARWVYFYAQTREPIRATGAPGAMVLTVKTAGGRTWSSDAPGAVTAARRSISGRGVEVAVPRSTLGLREGEAFTLTFKWRDNVGDVGDEGEKADPLNLYRNGDTAPNGRSEYVYRGSQ